MRIRPWQVATCEDFDSRPVTLALAWTEAGAWRKAHRLHRRIPRLRDHYACGDRLPASVPVGWVEVRATGDTRTMAEFLTDEANRGR